MKKKNGKNTRKEHSVAWNNNDNAIYYEAIPIETLKKYASIGGFEQGCDVELIFKHVRHAQSILEIGAGYGRVLNNLLERGYVGKLYAVERSKNLCEHLQKVLSKKVEIINEDIKQFQPTVKFEVIMWMWSSISDFSKLEHIPILKKITEWLSDDGLLVLDTISHNVKLANEFTFRNQTYIEKATHGTAYGYVPTSKEIAEYADFLNLEIKQLDYKTTTNRPRIIHLLEKKRS